MTKPNQEWRGPLGSAPLVHSGFPAMLLTMIVVVIPPAIAVAIAIPIPVVVMLEPPAVTVPVTAVKLAALITRSDPGSARIRRPGPISTMPPIAMAYGIPVPVHPIIISARRDRTDTHHAGTGWRANSDSHGYLSTVSRRSRQKHPGKHRGQ